MQLAKIQDNVFCKQWL